MCYKLQHNEILKFSQAWCGINSSIVQRKGQAAANLVELSEILTFWDGSEVVITVIVFGGNHAVKRF